MNVLGQIGLLSLQVNIENHLSEEKEKSHVFYLVCVQLELELENYREKFLSYISAFLK